MLDLKLIMLQREREKYEKFTDEIRQAVLPWVAAGVYVEKEPYYSPDYMKIVIRIPNLEYETVVRIERRDLDVYDTPELFYKFLIHHVREDFKRWKIKHPDENVILGEN